MRTEFDADLPFRLIPAGYWKPAPSAVLSAVGLSVWDRWEIFCLAWLHIEIEIGVFRSSNGQHGPDDPTD